MRSVKLGYVEPPSFCFLPVIGCWNTRFGQTIRIIPAFKYLAK